MGPRFSARCRVIEGSIEAYRFVLQTQLSVRKKATKTAQLIGTPTYLGPLENTHTMAGDLLEGAIGCDRDWATYHDRKARGLSAEQNTEDQVGWQSQPFRFTYGNNRPARCLNLSRLKGGGNGLNYWEEQRYNSRIGSNARDGCRSQHERQTDPPRVSPDPLSRHQIVRNAECEP